MAVNANKVRTIVDEVAKFKKEEIEFLFETIKNGMIPGKHLGIAMEVVNKLKSHLCLPFVVLSSDNEQSDIKRSLLSESTV